MFKFGIASFPLSSGLTGSKKESINIQDQADFFNIYMVLFQGFAQCHFTLSHILLPLLHHMNYQNRCCHFAPFCNWQDLEALKTLFSSSV